MAKKNAAEPIYKIVEVIGVSEISWEDAGLASVAAAQSVDKGKAVAFRTRVLLSFKYES